MKRRAKAIAILAKLQRDELDREAGELNELRARQQSFTDAHNELERRRIEESDIDMPEAIPYLTRFLKSVREEEGRLQKASQEVDLQIERQKEIVTAVWQEGKTTQHLQDEVRAKLRRQREAQEQSETEERNIIRHNRAKPKAS